MSVTLSCNKMDLFRDINKGKFGNNPKLKREAKHELGELGGEKLAEAHEKRVKMAGKMKSSHADISDMVGSWRSPGLKNVKYPSQRNSCPEGGKHSFESHGGKVGTVCRKCLHSR